MQLVHNVGTAPTIRTEIIKKKKKDEKKKRTRKNEESTANILFMTIFKFIFQNLIIVFGC